MIKITLSFIVTLSITKYHWWDDSFLQYATDWCVLYSECIKK